VADVGLDVHTLHTQNRINDQSARGAPVQKAVERLDVMVVGSLAEPVFVTNRPQALLNQFQCDVAKLFDLALIDNPHHSGHCQVDVLGRGVTEAQFEPIKVPLNR
jgi:hypothetical protein